MAKRYEKQLNRLFDYLTAVHQELVGSRRRRWVFDLDEELPFPFDDEEEATRKRGEGFVAERWQEVAPERYMAAQGLTEQERRLVRVLLMQALLERTSFRPFCGRLSQLMPLLVRERSLRASSSRCCVRCCRRPVCARAGLSGCRGRCWETIRG